MKLLQGIYEEVISKALDTAILNLENQQLVVEKAKIDAADSESILSRYLQKALEQGLRAIKDQNSKNGVKAEIATCNELLELLSRHANDSELLKWQIGQDGEQLLSIWDRSIQRAMEKHRPVSSIAISSIFTGSKKDPTLAYELEREIETADEVDFLVSFIRYSGLVKIRDALKDFTNRPGKKLRIITTTYMGNTEATAVERLAALPQTEIKISYDTRTTRLHAKSYIFRRSSGFTTAFVGSSNLSGAAVTEGMEWNLKVTNADMPQVITGITAAFDSYWASPDFEPYNCVLDHNRLRRALKHEHDRDPETGIINIFDFHPYPFQTEILNELKAEREVHHSCRNLIVAATGTGKTVVSAFDYKRFVNANSDQPNRFLYIAHRADILKKSLGTYRAILKDQNFGDWCDGNHDPQVYDHVFMTIQTFTARHFEQLLAPDYYDYIVVDETHHGAAESYQTLFEYFQPQILLGLTATPERTDGLDILHYFNDRIAAEIRLPEAIDRHLLVPFQYFAVTDPTDLSQVKFVRGRFDTEELNQLYLKDDGRVRAVLDAISRYCPNTDSIRGLGFCVSQQHAAYMAQRFKEAGIPAVALTAESPQSDRNACPQQLATGKLRFIFTVDIYNEGIDIPEVNLELMLRPTESLTIFIQQLGRGLRLCDNKSDLTVLDFVGQFNQNYTIYEKKLRYLTAGSNISVKKQIETEYEGLPLGCYVGLEKVAQERILNGIKNSTHNLRRIIQLLHDYHDETGRSDLHGFLDYSDLTLDALYKTGTTFTMLLQKAKTRTTALDKKYDQQLASGLRRLSDIDSRRWITALRRFLTDDALLTAELDRKMGLMLFYTFYQNTPLECGYHSLDDFLAQLRHSPYRTELLDLLQLRYEALNFTDEPVELGFPSPLDLHCTYTRNQILAGFGEIDEQVYFTWQEGVRELKGRHTDIFTIDLKKTENDFSATTRYKDYAISADQFHWQSQSRTTQHCTVGQRYLNQRQNGQNILLFVRPEKTQNGKTMPYVFLGKADFISASGNRPINIVWQTEQPMPTWVVEQSAPIRP